MSLWDFISSAYGERYDRRRTGERSGMVSAREDEAFWVVYGADMVRFPRWFAEAMFLWPFVASWPLRHSPDVPIEMGPLLVVPLGCPESHEELVRNCVSGAPEKAPFTGFGPDSPINTKKPAPGRFRSGRIR